MLAHLRVWQTQLSNIASSYFDIEKKTVILNQHDNNSAGTMCHTCWGKVIYMSVSQNTETLKGGQGHKASLKRMQRTITIQGLTLSTITAAENSL